MKIFPKHDYLIELNNDSSLAISELEKQTFPKEQFITNWNSHAFIGEIKESEFEIKLSKKIIGDICVLKVKLENEKGTLEIRTGKIFKIIFVAIIMFVLSGIITSIILNKLESIFYLVIEILIMRYVFLELSFRHVSKITINKLTKIIGIKRLTKIR